MKVNRTSNPPSYDSKTMSDATGNDGSSIEDFFEIHDSNDNSQLSLPFSSGSHDKLSFDEVQNFGTLYQIDRPIQSASHEPGMIYSSSSKNNEDSIGMLDNDYCENDTKRLFNPVCNEVQSTATNSISSVPPGNAFFDTVEADKHAQAERCDPNRIGTNHRGLNHHLFGRTKFQQFGENRKIIKNSDSTSLTASRSEGGSDFEDEFYFYEKTERKCGGWKHKCVLIFGIVLVAAALIGAICGNVFGVSQSKKEEKSSSKQATLEPTRMPSPFPSKLPSSSPSGLPSAFPTKHPSQQPSVYPSLQPSAQPSQSPTITPTMEPSAHPSQKPTITPSVQPSVQLSQFPTIQPTAEPTNPQTKLPTRSPTKRPTNAPIANSETGPQIKPGQFYFSLIESGPLVGHTTHHSTSIWAFHGQGKIMQLTYRRFGDAVASNTVRMFPRFRNNFSALITIRGLEENTHYVFEIKVNAEVVATGQFKTALAFKPGKFEYLLTSCMNIHAHKGYPDQPVWKSVLEKDPDFAILAGDTIYLTEEDWTADTREVIYKRVWYRNMEQRSEPHFARVIGSVPTYAAWDDHEYGSNNAEKNQPGKNNSLKAFRDVWANPGYGTPEIRGNFYDYYWGDVHFIVLDNRWYRDRNEQTQFGSAQKSWLYQKLKSSRGTFKVIVNGCDIMEVDYGKDVDDIGLFVKANNIDGVIFNAGDIHRNEFKQERNDNWPYPVTQYSSSGIARDNWMRPWSIIKVNTELADPEITAHFYGADSEALNSTWSNDPNLRCSSIQEVDLSKEARCTETIRLSDLTPSTVQVSDTLLFPPEKPGDIDKPTGPISNIDFSKTNFTVGTYYYPWYGDTSFNGRNYLRAELSPPQYPTLGEYDQRNEEVITQHLKWSEQANINLWVTSWWGPDSATNRNTLAITNNGYLAESKIKLALFYETKGRIPANGDVGNVYGDIAYAAENYFNDPNYYKIYGRPVFYVYLARDLHAIGKLDNVISEMRRAARDKGFNIYIVGDMAHSAPPQGHYAAFDWLDAITEYDVFGSMGRPDYAGDDNRVEFYRSKQENWRQAAHRQKSDFIPSITPGYNDKGVRNQAYSSMSRKLTRNSEFGSLFQALLNNALDQVDSATGNAFMVTSFNEWHEDTQIEPIVGELTTNQPYNHTGGKEYEVYGTRYLDILRNGTKLDPAI